MLNINSFDHINLFVSNLDKSLDFYHEIFGMKVKEEGLGSNGKPYRIIDSGNVYFALYEKGEAVSSGSINHIGIHINDFDKAHQRLKEKGIELHYGGVVEYDNSRSMYIEDPDGYSFELSEVFAGAL